MFIYSGNLYPYIDKGCLPVLNLSANFPYLWQSLVYYSINSFTWYLCIFCKSWCIYQETNVSKRLHDTQFGICLTFVTVLDHVLFITNKTVNPLLGKRKSYLISIIWGIFLEGAGNVRLLSRLRRRSCSECCCMLSDISGLSYPLAPVLPRYSPCRDHRNSPGRI